MTMAVHSIRSETLEIAVTSEALALVLQPQMSELNRSRLMPVIERVLDEFDTEDRHVSLGRVAIDLGVLPLETLAEGAEAALYEALQRALRGLVPDGNDGDDATVDPVWKGAGPLGTLAEYLLYGTLPFWAASANVPRADFSAQELVASLLAREPANLAALLRRIGGAPHVLERLILQLDEQALAAVLRLLEPAHAALVLAYMLDLREIHRSEPVAPIDDAGLRRLLWLLTFTYLLREPGSQFNRKSFVLALLGGIAQRDGLDLRDLILALGRGLQTTVQRLPLVSSLPALIAELMQEMVGGEASAEARIGAELRPVEFAATAAEPAQLAELVRRRGRERAWLQNFVAALDERTLEAVLRRLEPSYAAIVLGYLAELAALHRSEPLLPLAQQRFERLLWTLTFTYLTTEPGSQFNRRSFLSSLLHGAARSEGVAYDDLVATLTRGLEAAAQRLPVAASLPGVLQDIVRERDAPRLTHNEGVEDDARADAIVYLLRHGYWPPGFLLSHRGLSARALAEALAQTSLAGLRRFVFAATVDARLQMLLRLVRALPADAFIGLLHRWLPAAADPANPLAAALEDAAQRAPDRQVFHARLLANLLEGAELDLEEFARSEPVPASDAGEPEHWPAARLASAMLTALQGDPAEDGPGLHRMLSLLVTRHPADAKIFLQAVLPRPDGEALLATVPAEDDDRILALAGSAAAQIFAVLRAALQSLPLAEQKASQAVRRAMLEAALRSSSDARAIPAEIGRALRFLFGGQLPVTVVEHLAAALEQSSLPISSRAIAISALAESGQTPAPAPRRSATTLRDLFLGWLRDSSSDEPFSFEAWAEAFDAVFATEADGIRRLILEHADRSSARERWVIRLPRSILARLVQALDRRQGRAFLQAAERLYDRVLDVPGNALAQSSIWSALLLYLTATPEEKRSPENLLANLAENGSAEDELTRAARRLREMDDAPERHEAQEPSAPPRPRPAVTPVPSRQRPRPSRGKTAFSLGEEEAEGGDPIYVDNAGLVLVGPFLPHLFRSLDMLVAEDGRTRLRGGETVSRAVHLLQYLADGRCSAPEPLLVLNKILCGVSIETPVEAAIEPSMIERDLCGDLLGAVIARWAIVANSSVSALRETFFQREGRLVRKDEAWHLTVSRKTLDVLVDRVPWTVSLIYNDWMPHPLHVTW
jgi:hypothetical protein